jgi:hypothetical protein
MGCSSGVGLAPSVHWNSFLSPEELLNASLRSEGFSPKPVGIVGGSESFGATFLGAAALGERLCLSCPVMSECEAPIYHQIPSRCRDITRKRRKAV